MYTFTDGNSARAHNNIKKNKATCLYKHFADLAEFKGEGRRTAFWKISPLSSHLGYLMTNKRCLKFFAIEFLFLVNFMFIRCSSNLFLWIENVCSENLFVFFFINATTLFLFTINYFPEIFRKFFFKPGLNVIKFNSISVWANISPIS